MTKIPAKWALGREFDWRENPHILEDGPWDYLDNIDRDASTSDVAKAVGRLLAVATDRNWWKGVDSKFRAVHGDALMDHFHQEFTPVDAVHFRCVAIIGKQAVDKSPAGHVCWLAGESRKSHYPPDLLQNMRRQLADWLLEVIEHRDSHTAKQLAAVLDDWPQDVPTFDYTERFRIDTSTAKFMLLGDFVELMRRERKLPTKGCLKEKLGITESDQSGSTGYDRDLRELGMANLPRE